MDRSRIRYDNRELCDGRRELRVIYPNGPLAVREALATVMDALGGLGLSRDEQENTELVLAEVLNNIAEHAYPDDPNGIVEMEILAEGDHLACAVRDTGPPMPPELIDAATHPAEADPTRLPEGGFGWFLIHTLACEVSYRRCPGRNELSFEMRPGASIAAM